jgi:hypothetical protein
LGRTGTQFFSKLFSNILSDVTALHEPDVLHFDFKKGYDLNFLKEQFLESGFKNLLLKKMFGKWSLIQLSDKRLKGEITKKELRNTLLKQRNDFIRSQTGKVYVESNAGYYGLIDIIYNLSYNHNSIYIVRDPRSWIQSKINWNVMYNKGTLKSLLVHTWPKASEIPTDPFFNKWHKMTRFEKLCWAWSKMNGFALANLNYNPNAKIYKFEDIFESENRYDNVKDLVEFATTFQDGTKLDYKPLDGWLEKKVHGSSGGFPSWENWTKEQKETFRRMCGPLMEKLGYEVD